MLQDEGMAAVLERYQNRARETRTAVGALVLLMATYVTVFGTLTWIQQSNFGTFGFDLGVYDQVVWLLSRLKAPFYWLGWGPHFLLLSQTIWLAVGAVPVWLLARDRLESAWMAVVLAAAWLLYPAVEWINWWHFHPDALIATPLLFAYWLATRRRWRWFAGAVVVAMLCKEDAALAVFMLGLLIAWRGDRKVGLITSGAALGWFLLSTKVILPAGNGVGPFYESLFPGFGNSVTQIAWNIVRHPSRFINVVAKGDRPEYYRQLLGPVAFLPVLALPVLLIAAPQLVTNVISGHAYTAQIKYHYTAIPAAVSSTSARDIASTARPPAGASDNGHKITTPAMIAKSRQPVPTVPEPMTSPNVAWSPSPLSVKYHDGIWALHSSARNAAVKEALALVPRAAGVSTTYYMVPHLSRRVKIFEWPNPWVVTNWGVNGENPPKPSDATYLVLDTELNGDSDPLF